MDGTGEKLLVKQAMEMWIIRPTGEARNFTISLGRGDIRHRLAF